jgi:hypothetical protein
MRAQQSDERTGYSSRHVAAVATSHVALTLGGGAHQLWLLFLGILADFEQLRGKLPCLKWCRLGQPDAYVFGYAN